jgi:uncharacterized protein YceK
MTIVRSICPGEKCRSSANAMHHAVLLNICHVLAGFDLHGVGDLVIGRRFNIFAWLSLIVVFTIMILVAGCASFVSAGYSSGVWDNFDYNKPATYWTSAVKTWGGSNGVLDLAVVQARDQYAALPFPYQDCGTFHSVSGEDLAEPYLSQFDSEGLGVILSIQPVGADVNELISIILARYGHHKCIVGINIDLEWKTTGNPLHASNEERDAWTRTISGFNPQLKLFLTYFKDYTYFPDDDGKMVIMYDGLGDTQENILSAYGELAKHFTNVGIYTGYQSSSPPTASDDRILAAAPNTRYIIHTDDVNSGPVTAAADEGNLLSTMPKAKTGFRMPSMSGLSGMSGFPANGLSMPAISRDSGSGNGGLFSKAMGSLGGSAKSSDSDSQSTAGENRQSTWHPAGNSIFNGFGSGKMAIPVKSIFS